MESSYDINIKLPKSLVHQKPLPQILYSAGLAASRSEGQRLINNKGIYIGGQIGKDGQPVPMGDTVTYVPATNPKWSSIEPLILGDLLILRSGKWKKKFIQIVSDEEYEASGQTCPGWKEQTETAADPITKADLAGEEALRMEGNRNANLREQRHRDRKSMQAGPFSTLQGARMRRDQ